MKTLLSFLLFEFLSGYLGRFLIINGCYDTMITLPSILLFIFTIFYFLKIEKLPGAISSKVTFYFLAVEGLLLGNLMDYAILILLNPSSYPGIAQINEGFFFLILFFVKNLFVFSTGFFISYAYFHMRKIFEKSE